MSLATVIQQNTAAVKANTLAQNKNTMAVNVLSSDIRESVDLLAEVSAKLDRVIELLDVPIVPDPGPINFRVTGESAMGIQFAADLPANEPEGTPEGEIVGGRLTVTIAGVDQVIETAKGQTVVEGLLGQEGDPVRGSFVHIDNNGNPSVNPAVAEFVLSDTIPPGDPGALGFRVTGEV